MDDPVVLTGPGGLGKTRLAAQIAQRLLAVFPDGVYFVGLAGIVADTVDNAIAEGFHVRREPQRSALDSVIGWLRDRHVLLVLDNCEEVVSAAHTAVEVLMAQCPGLHVLATSRLPLGLPAELRVPLPPLDGLSAMELFVDRLVVTGSGIDVERGNGSLEQLCRRLDGIPLALELAAARCRTLTPGQLLVRLERRPQLLNDAAGLFEERHRDLDRLIASSIHELSPTAQHVLERLTVVIGSFTLETGEAIAADDLGDVDVVDALEELADAGLITREHGEGEPQHRVLEPIRQHVATRLDEHEHAEAIRRHRVWFTELAQSVAAGSVGPSFGYWADLAERETENFRRAHRSSIAAGDVERATAIVGGLAIVGQERGLLELTDWCDATVAMVDGRNDHFEVAALAAAAPFWYFQNRLSELRAAVDRTATIVADPEHHLTLRQFAAQVALDPDRWSETADLLEQALATYGADRTTWRTAQIDIFLVWLGRAPDTARLDRIAEVVDSPVFSATLAFYRAIHRYVAGDEAVATELAGQAVGLMRASGALIHLGRALMGYGGWRVRLPDTTLDDVFGPLAESLELCDRLRVPLSLVMVSEEIAQSLATRGHPEEAFVLWGAVDSSGVQSPSKFARPRTAPYVAAVPDEQAGAWQARGAALTMDEMVAFARRTVATILT